MKQNARWHASPTADNFQLPVIFAVGVKRTCVTRAPEESNLTIQFNIQQFYVLPTQCIYVFCVYLRTNSDYFPIQP
jgi:hypothetical protein